MVKFLVQRPIAVTVSFFAFIMLGVASYLRLPVSLLPDVDIPEITVRLDTHPFPAQDAEIQIIAPLRQQLLQMSGLKDIESVAADGYGLIRLDFDHGTNMSMAFVEVNEKIDLTMNRLPREIARPIVSRMGIDDIPVYHLAIYPKNESLDPTLFLELSTFVREIVRRRLEQLPEISMIDMTGATFPEIALMPRETVLRQLGLEAHILQKIIMDNQIAISQVLVQDGYYRYFLKFSNGWMDVETIRNYPIQLAGRLLTIHDLAEVETIAAEASGSYYHGNEPALTVAIIKQNAARMADLQNSVHQVVAELQASYPDLVFDISQDQTELLDYAMNNLEQDLVVGGLLAFLCMWIFIRRPGMALLIGITIPVSLLISLLGFYLLGISLNIISLGGLILGLSMIIDNSIVVMDAISNRRTSGETIGEAAIRGTTDVIRPLVTSVLTNCAVFVPLIFLSGLAGEMFYDQAMSIVIGVFSSLIVAIVLIPPLYRLINRDKEQPYHASKPLINTMSIYDQGLRWSFKYPYVLTVIVVLVSSSGFFWYKALEKTRLPTLTATDMEIHIEWNESISFEENKSRMLALASNFVSHAEKWNTWIGTQQYQLALYHEQGMQESLVYARFSSEEMLNEQQNAIHNWIQSHHPLAIIKFSPAKNAMDQVFGQDIADLNVQFSASNQRKAPAMETLKQFVLLLREELPDARIDPVAIQHHMSLTIDPMACVRYGLTPTEIAKALETTFREVSIGHLYGQETSAALILKPQQYPTVATALKSTYVKNSLGERFPLEIFVTSSMQQDFRAVYAGAQGMYYPVAITTNTPAGDATRIKSLMEENDQIDGVILGSYFENQRLIREMFGILLVSIILLYFILAAQFESLLQPLFILVELPIALSGALLFLFLGGSSLNLMSMIGIVVMSGLIINDSILKIDAINQLRLQGVPLMQAIFEGGHKRLNSIIMITLTSVGALAPTLFMSDMGSEMQRPLVLALLGGMSVGLLVSLFFVPVVYWAVYKKL